MRKKIVAGNWKMHGTRSSVTALIQGIKEGSKALSSAIDIIVFPSFVFLPQVENLLSDTAIQWGAQNAYLESQGAFTGEISNPMLKEFGCQYVLVGHSERRAIFKEDLQLIAAKFKSALNAGLTPILCIGETREQREAGKTEEILSEQLDSVIKACGIESFNQAIIAYEPVWAIGTGLTATPEQAQEIHAFIRRKLIALSLDIGNRLRILYGGSVKADNAADLFAMPDIDGGLIGGASLEAKSFLKICEAAVTASNSVTQANSTLGLTG